MFKSSIGFLPVLATGVLAAAAAASATAGTYLVGSRNPPPSVAVRYDDLNLATADGRSSLYHRLRLAAQKVCPRADGSDLEALTLVENCQIAAVQRAVRAIGGPMVSQLQAEHGLAQERTVSQD
jgi:UrcA family protein